MIELESEATRTLVYAGATDYSVKVVGEHDLEVTKDGKIIIKGWRWKVRGMRYWLFKPRTVVTLED